MEFQEPRIDIVYFFLQGKTGFPWIDANIAKLKQEGWIDYEARQSLAYFLTRGCLWINWEEGVKVSILSRRKRKLKSCLKSL